MIRNCAMCGRFFKAVHKRAVNCTNRSCRRTANLKRIARYIERQGGQKKISAERTRKYREDPEYRSHVLARQKIYNQVSERREKRATYIRAHMAEPEIAEKRRAYLAEYMTRPGVSKMVAAQQKRSRLKNADHDREVRKAYRNRPEVKARLREQKKKYRPSSEAAEKRRQRQRLTPRQRTELDKIRMKLYWQRPENRARHRARCTILARTYRSTDYQIDRLLREAAQLEEMTTSAAGGRK